MKQPYRHCYYLVLLVLGTSQNLSAQWGFDEPDPLIYLDFRAEIGIMNSENLASDRFALLRPSFYGFHVEAGHYFENFGVFSGLGFSIMPFRQKQSRPIGVIASERINSSVSFFSAQIPIGVSYKLARSFSLHAAINFNFMNGFNVRHEVLEGAVPEDFTLALNKRDEMPSWQVVPEVNFGLDYDIGSRLRFLFYGAASLGSVQGVSWDYTLTQLGEDSQNFDIDFDYRWWRFGVGLTYHIIR